MRRFQSVFGQNRTEKEVVKSNPKARKTSTDHWRQEEIERDQKPAETKGLV